MSAPVWGGFDPSQFFSAMIPRGRGGRGRGGVSSPGVAQGNFVVPGKSYDLPQAYRELISGGWVRSIRLEFGMGGMQWHASWLDSKNNTVTDISPEQAIARVKDAKAEKARDERRVLFMNRAHERLSDDRKNLFDDGHADVDAILLACTADERAVLEMKAKEWKSFAGSEEESSEPRVASRRDLRNPVGPVRGPSPLAGNVDLKMFKQFQLFQQFMAMQKASSGGEISEEIPADEDGGEEGDEKPPANKELSSSSSEPVLGGMNVLPQRADVSASQQRRGSGAVSISSEADPEMSPEAQSPPLKQAKGEKSSGKRRSSRTKD